MIKHIPAVIFFICLVLVIINVSLWNDMVLYLGAIGVGSAAMVVQHVMEKREKKGSEPDHASQVAHWQAQWQHVAARLQDARANPGDDRVSFLESQLADAERQLKKLGAPKPMA